MLIRRVYRYSLFCIYAYIYIKKKINTKPPQHYVILENHLAQIIIEIATILFIHLLLLVTVIKCVGGFSSCLLLLTKSEGITCHCKQAPERATKPLSSEKTSHCHFEISIAIQISSIIL